jgi:hypothetical protein
VRGGAAQTRELLRRNEAISAELERRGVRQEDPQLQRALQRRGQAMPDAGPQDGAVVEGRAMPNLFVGPTMVTAFHGTPRSFTKFDASKARSGDFAHGIYFAIEPDEAATYGEALAKGLAPAAEVRLAWIESYIERAEAAMLANRRDPAKVDLARALELLAGADGEEAGKLVRRAKVRLKALGG